MPYLRGTSQSSFHKPVAVDRRRIDDEAGAVKRGAAVGRLLDDQPGARLGIQQTRELRHFCERLRIAADQRQRAAAQLVAAEDVAQHAQPERHAGGADEDDLGLIGHRRSRCSPSCGGAAAAAWRSSASALTAVIVRVRSS